MGGFMGWILTFVLVWAIFNAEKLPDLRAKIEEKIKNSVDAAKEGSKLASDKLKQVKNDIENRKNAVTAPAEAEENTPEEIEESLQFMGNYLKEETKEEEPAELKNPAHIAEQTSKENEPKTSDVPADEEDEKPIDLENRY